jgi:hypothetical protein
VTPTRVEHRLELVERRGVGQVALVVLHDERELRQVVAVLRQVVVQVLHALHVRLRAVELRVGDEHHAVDAAQDEAAAGVVVHLPGHGVQVEARLEAADRPRSTGRKSKKSVRSVSVASEISFPRVDGFTFS